MKQATINALRRLHVFTNALCAKCHPAFGCCSVQFCEYTAIGLRAVGRPVPARGLHPTLPFMGPEGCVISPELRPGCTGFVCFERVSDRKLARKWERLQKRAFDDEEVTIMRDASGAGARSGLADLMKEKGESCA